MGKGYSKYAMAEILRKGKEQMGLTDIYWCVSRENIKGRNVVFVTIIKNG